MMCHCRLELSLSRFLLDLHDDFEDDVDFMMLLSLIVLQSESYFFTGLDYIIGDSAFNPSLRMVRAYKKDIGMIQLPMANEFFNTKLASARIKSEHCIGLVKNRFPCLRGLNVDISKPCHVKRVVQIFTSCAILHNLLLNEPNIPNEWYEMLDENLDIETENMLLDYFNIQAYVREQERREQVKNSMIALFHAGILD